MRETVKSFRGGRGLWYCDNKDTFLKIIAGLCRLAVETTDVSVDQILKAVREGSNYKYRVVTPTGTYEEMREYVIENFYSLHGLIGLIDGNLRFCFDKWSQERDREREERSKANGGNPVGSPEEERREYRYRVGRAARRTREDHLPTPASQATDAGSSSGSSSVTSDYFIDLIKSVISNPEFRSKHPALCAISDSFVDQIPRQRKTERTEQTTRNVEQDARQTTRDTEQKSVKKSNCPFAKWAPLFSGCSFLSGCTSSHDEATASKCPVLAWLGAKPVTTSSTSSTTTGTGCPFAYLFKPNSTANTTAKIATGISEPLKVNRVVIINPDGTWKFDGPSTVTVHSDEGSSSSSSSGSSNGSSDPTGSSNTPSTNVPTADAFGNMAKELFAKIGVDFPADGKLTPAQCAKAYNVGFNWATGCNGDIGLALSQMFQALQNNEQSTSKTTVTPATVAQTVTKAEENVSSSSTGSSAGSSTYSYTLPTTMSVGELEDRFSELFGRFGVKIPASLLSPADRRNEPFRFSLSLEDKNGGLTSLLNSFIKPTTDSSSTQTTSTQQTSQSETRGEGPKQVINDTVAKVSNGINDLQVLKQKILNGEREDLLAKIKMYTGLSREKVLEACDSGQGMLGNLNGMFTKLNETSTQLGPSFEAAKTPEEKEQVWNAMVQNFRPLIGNFLNAFGSSSSSSTSGSTSSSTSCCSTVSTPTSTVTADVTSSVVDIKGKGPATVPSTVPSTVPTSESSVEQGTQGTTQAGVQSSNQDIGTAFMCMMQDMMKFVGTRMTEQPQAYGMEPNVASTLSSGVNSMSNVMGELFAGATQGGGGAVNPQAAEKMFDVIAGCGAKLFATTGLDKPQEQTVVTPTESLASDDSDLLAMMDKSIEASSTPVLDVTPDLPVEATSETTVDSDPHAATDMDGFTTVDPVD